MKQRGDDLTPLLQIIVAKIVEYAANVKKFTNAIALTYANTDLKDKLTSVNGVELTYDANGNLKSYGEKQYTWNYGKSLGSITDGENTYSYTYNENGIRASKNINGVKTEINTINGKVLAQKTSEDILYFQYDSSDVPVGFVYNDAAYYYITNISNDVVGITDSAGNIIAEYEYDEWGKLISVEAESEEAQTIAQMNPLRYRGYYYDNETGYYYLQSRYYDPGLGRFISADDFSYIDASEKSSINAYAYCANNSVNFIDPSGHVGEALLPVIFYLSMFCTGLIIIFLMVYVIVYGITGTAPEVSLPSFSIPSAAERADANVRSKIKNAKGTLYWIANRVGIMLQYLIH